MVKEPAMTLVLIAMDGPTIATGEVLRQIFEAVVDNLSTSGVNYITTTTLHLTSYSP